MKISNVKKIVVLGMVSCLLTGCSNEIPELTEEEASLIATYAADVTLGHSKESVSRLMDTEAETARLEELSEKIEKMQGEKAQEEEEQKKESVKYTNSEDGTANSMQKPENIAEFIELDGFQVDYAGYAVEKSYAADDTEEWEPTLDATAGKNLLVIKLMVTNISDASATLDVFSKDMMFSIEGDNGINNMALVTMLLNDFAFARDEIAAGESREYVLISQIDESITEIGSISLHMKKGDESMIVALQ